MNALTNFIDYSVVQADAFGNDYTSNVSLTPQEARDRIVDGRLLSADEGHRRNYARLWEAFKAMQPGPGGMGDTSAAQARYMAQEEYEQHIII
jgi:hypothetical protein